MRFFFFYGTLIAGGGNPVGERVHTRLRALGSATARGLLFAIPTPQGWYPALLPDGDDAVHGMVYAALPGWTDAELALLDAYENHDPDRPEASEYLRRRIRVVLGESEAPAEAYVYAAQLPADAVRLPHGDFRRFLTERGVDPYRP